jgi:hypothetical protein
VTTIFSKNTVTINSSSPVLKSEDGENYSFLFEGGEYIDRALCLPSNDESPNYYFYSGDGAIQTVACKTT